MRRAEEILGGRIEWWAGQQCYAWYRYETLTTTRFGSSVPYLRFQRLFHGDDGLMDYMVTKRMNEAH